MTQAQESCLAMMAEVQRICNENRIRVYLIDRQLWAAQNNKDMLGYEADFAMFYDDFASFRKIVSEEFGAEREFESYEENDALPGLYYRYVNAETTFFNLDEFKAFEKKGAYVNIHIIRNNGAAQNKLSVYEWGMGSGLHKSRRARIYGALSNVLRKVKGQEHFKKRILGLYEKARERKPGKTELKMPLGKRLVFPEGFWDNQKTCNLSGIEFTTVKDSKQCLKLRYGSSWVKKNVKGKRDNYMCVCCPNIPYTKYWDYLDKGDYDDEFFSKRDRYLSTHKENIKDYNKQTKQAWDVFFSIEQQFKLKDRLEGRKEKILSFWRRGEHDRAVLMMGDYVSLIEEYRRKKVDFVADEELRDIYLEWLLENGRDGIADTLKKLSAEGQFDKR